MPTQLKTSKKRLVKEHLLKVQHNRCFYCKHEFINRKVTIDHVISRKNGGTNKKENLVLSCKICQRLEDNEKLALVLGGLIANTQDYYQLVHEAFKKEFNRFQKIQSWQALQTRQNIRIL